MDCALMYWRLILILITFGFTAAQSTEASHNVKEGENITYVSSSNLDGMAVLSTLTIETTTTTAYDQLNPSLTTTKFKEIEESEETTTRRMRKVLKHIYKRPIHSKNDEKINKQDVLLSFRDSGKDLLMVSEKKLTDANKSDVILMNESSTTDSGILNKEYNKSTEGHKAHGFSIATADNSLFEVEKADLKIKSEFGFGQALTEETTKTQDIFSTSLVEGNEDSLFEFSGVTEHNIFDISDNEEIQKYIKLLGQTKSYPQIAIETTTESLSTFTTLQEKALDEISTPFTTDSITTSTTNVVIEHSNDSKEKVGGSMRSSNISETQEIDRVIDEFFKFNKSVHQESTEILSDVSGFNKHDEKKVNEIDKGKIFVTVQGALEAVGEDKVLGDHILLTNVPQENKVNESQIIPTISLPSLDEIIQLTPEVEDNSEVNAVNFNQTEEVTEIGLRTTITEVKMTDVTSYGTDDKANTGTNEAEESLKFVNESLRQEEQTDIPVILLTNIGISRLNVSSEAQSDIFSFMNHSALENEHLDSDDLFDIPKLEGLTADSEEFEIDSNEKPLMDDDRIISDGSENDTPLLETSTSESNIMIVPTKMHSNRKHKCKSERENKKKCFRNKDRIENPVFITERIFGQEANFSILINIRNTTIRVPSNVSLIDDYNKRRLYMSWLSENGERNNSLMIIFPAEETNRTGILELCLVEGDDMRTWRKELQDATMSDFDWTTDLDVGSKILINNLRWREFFESRESLEANLSFGEQNRDKVFHILLGVGICVILSVLGFLFFYIVAKRKQDNELNMRQTTLNEVTITDKQTPL